MKNSFEILGVPETATLEEIKSAYKKLAKKYHTDISGESSSEFMKEINSAYDTLKSPEKIELYRRQLQAQRQGFSGIFHNGGFSQDPLQDIFQDIFGSRFNGFARPSRDLRFTIQISLQEAYEGRKGVSIRYQTPTGQNSLSFDIPPLTNHNTEMVFPSRGRTIDNKTGDLRISISVMPDITGWKVATPNGDLLYDLKISYLDALLGIHTSLDFLSGENFSIDCPGIIADQQTHVIPNKGLMSNGFRGHAIVRFFVTSEGISAQDVEKIRSVLRPGH